MDKWANIRRRLATLPTDADFEAFCLTYYPKIQKLFSSGMSRTEKINILHAHVEDPANIGWHLDDFVKEIRNKSHGQIFTEVHQPSQKNDRLIFVKGLALGAIIVDWFRRIMAQYETLLYRILGHSEVAVDVTARGTAVSGVTAALVVTVTGVAILAPVSMNQPPAKKWLVPADEANEALQANQGMIRAQSARIIPYADNCFGLRGPPHTIYDSNLKLCVDVWHYKKLVLEDGREYEEHKSRSCEPHIEVFRANYCGWKGEGPLNTITDPVCGLNFPPFRPDLDNVQAYCNFLGKSRCKYRAVHDKRELYHCALAE